MRSIPCPFVSLVLWVLPLSAAANAQSIWFTRSGEDSGDHYGFSVDSAGDVNADGYGDYLVGAPEYTSDDKTLRGRAYLYHADGSLRFILSPSGSAGGRFGAAVSGACDVNDDGYDDVIVGDPADKPPANNYIYGSATVFDGRTGQVLWKFWGPDNNPSAFGHSVSDVGDVNQDGHADLLIGDPGWDRVTATGIEYDVGAVYVYSGRDGALLALLQGEQAGDAFGHAVASATHANNDGMHDIAVGAPRYDAYSPLGPKTDAGKAYIFLGGTWNLHWSAEGSAAGNEFGHSLSARWMTNSANWTNIVVGQPRDDFHGTDSGSVRVYKIAPSGGAHQLMYTVYGDGPGDLFGWSVSRTLDMNCDQLADFVVGAPSSEWASPGGIGYVRTFAGVSGNVIYTVYPATFLDSMFGYSVGEVSDANHAQGASGYTFGDIVVGEPNASYHGNSSGQATVYVSHGSKFVVIPGGAWPGTHGTPDLAGGGSAIVGQDVSLSLTNSAGRDTPGWLLLGFGEDCLPTPWGGKWVVRPRQLLPLPVPRGGMSLSGPLPDDPALIGVEVTLQVMMFDAGASHGFSFSNGLGMLVGLY